MGYGYRSVAHISEAQTSRARMPAWQTWRSAPRSVLLLVLFLYAVLAWAAGPGFRTNAQFEAHYRKHGSEFGHISKQEYLRLAQELRDAPPGGPILQYVRPDGAITRFDKRKGYFGAYNPEGTIRTFFIPVDGERYFRRQARRARDD